MNPIIVRERMSRDEMFKRYPNKYLLVIDAENGINQLYAEAGIKTGFVVAAFDSLADACKFVNNDIENAGSSRVMHSENYTEEVFNLGFCFVDI